jgi:hypothetical protein
VARVNIYNNLVTLWDTTSTGGAGHTDLIIFSPGVDIPNGGVAGVPHDIVVQHNTVIPFNNQSCFGGVYFSVANVPPTNHAPPWSQSITNNIWIQDNVLCKQTTGDWGLTGMTALTDYMGSPSASPNDITQRFYGNLMYGQGGTLYTWPANNTASNTVFTYNADSTLNTPSLTTTYGPPTPPHQTGWLGVSGPVTLLSISVTPISPTIGVGGTVQLTATGNYSNGSTANLTSTATWASSSTANATVAAGLVTGVAAGATVISASQSGVTGTDPVTVVTMGSGPTVIHGQFTAQGNSVIKK